MTCVIANVQLFVSRPSAENFLSLMQQDIMGAFTTRLIAFAGFRALPEQVVRLQASKTQLISRGELRLLSWGLFLKNRTTPEWVFTLTLEARSINWLSTFKAAAKILWVFMETSL